MSWKTKCGHVLLPIVATINMFREKEPFQKENIVFQPSFFNGTMLVFGRKRCQVDEKWRTTFILPRRFKVDVCLFVYPPGN